jgi:hypothetical protein
LKILIISGIILSRRFTIKQEGMMRWMEVVEGMLIARPDAAPGEFMLVWPEQLMLAISWYDTESGEYKWIEPAKLATLVKNDSIMDAIARSWGFWVAFAIIELANGWEEFRGFSEYCEGVMKKGLEQIAMNDIGAGSRLASVGRDLLILAAADTFNSNLIAQKLNELYAAKGIE